MAEWTSRGCSRLRPSLTLCSIGARYLRSFVQVNNEIIEQLPACHARGRGFEPRRSRGDFKGFGGGHRIARLAARRLLQNPRAASFEWSQRARTRIVAACRSSSNAGDSHIDWLNFGDAPSNRQTLQAAGRQLGATSPLNSETAMEPDRRLRI